MAIRKTREPGGTPVGDAIRALVLNPASDMLPETEVYLYAASRAEHVRRVIRPALQENRVVVCDRFFDASIAYQGYGIGEQGGLTPTFVEAVNAPAIGELVPDLTIVLDVPIDLALYRVDARNMAQADRIEKRGPDFFARVRSGLLKIYEQNRQRVTWLDGSLPVHELADQIFVLVQKTLERAGNSP